MKLSKVSKIALIIIGVIAAWALIVNFVISPLFGSSVTEETITNKQIVKPKEDKEVQSTAGPTEEELKQSGESIENGLRILGEAYDGRITGFEPIDGSLENGMWVYVSSEMKKFSDVDKKDFVSGAGYEAEKIVTGNSDLKRLFVVFRYQSNNEKMAEYFNGKTTLK